MRNKDAMKIIDDHERMVREPPGYMVSFEHVDGAIFRSDYFPDKHAGEPLIKTEADAWEIAKRFNDATGSDYVNIYVVDHVFHPVEVGWEKTLNRRNVV